MPDSDAPPAPPVPDPAAPPADAEPVGAPDPGPPAADPVSTGHVSTGEAPAESALERLRRRAAEAAAGSPAAARTGPPTTSTAPASPTTPAPPADPTVGTPAATREAEAQPPAQSQPDSAEPAAPPVPDVIDPPAPEQLVVEADDAGGTAPARPAADAPVPVPAPLAPAVDEAPVTSSESAVTGTEGAVVAPDPVQTVADPRVEPPVETLEEPVPPHRPTRNPRWLVSLAAVLTVLVAAGAVLAALLGRGALHRRDAADDRTEAAAAARQMLLDFTNESYDKLDDWLARVQRDSTGGLRDQFGSSKDTLLAVQTPNQVALQGEAPLATATTSGDTATAIVLSSVRTTSTKAPAGNVQVTRWSVKLQRTAGVWKTVALDPIAAEANQ